MKVGLIGIGGWGRNHARVLKELGQEGMIDDLVFCDVDADRAQEAAGSEYEWTSNAKDVIGDPSVDAVEVVTPTPTHGGLSRAALEQGKDVFVEKPMTGNPEEAQELANLVEETGQILQVGHIFRYHPAVRRLKELVDEGAFGDLLLLETRREAYREPRKDMGVLQALAVHEVDLYCHLAGVTYPDALQATTASFHREGIEQHATVHMDLPNGTQAHATESWLAPHADKRREMVAVGSHLTAKVDLLDPTEIELFDASLEEIADNGKPEFRPVHQGRRTEKLEYREPLKEEVKSFVRCVGDRETPLADATVGRRAVEMVEACQKSADSGTRLHADEIRL